MMSVRVGYTPLTQVSIENRFLRLMIKFPRIDKFKPTHNAF